jgi:CRISPR system Cascade subunit CasA
MTEHFLLTEEPWIPCISLDGESRCYSLREIFQNADCIREISDQSPLVVAGLHRFLLAIHLRAMGSMDLDMKADMWEHMSLRTEKVVEYLERWSSRLDLFDIGHPFYQVSGFTTSKLTPIHKLSPERSVGNNKILFDHRLDEESESVSAAEAARLLIATQSYAIGETGGGGNRARTNSPLIGTALVLMNGDNLVKTMLLNSVNYDPGYPLAPLGNKRPKVLEDVPRWEMDSVLDDERFPLGYLDYLTWQNRSVRLKPDEGGVRVMWYAQGTKYGRIEGTYDPMVSYKSSKKGELRPIGIDIVREPWRDLSALIQLRSDIGRSPQTIEETSQLLTMGIIDDSSVSRLKVIGMAHDQDAIAKVLVWKGASMPLALRYLKDRNRVSWIERALDMADSQANVLSQSIWDYARFILKPSDGGGEQCGSVKIVSGDISKPSDRNKKQREIWNLWSSIDGMPRYWADSELPFYELVNSMASFEGSFPINLLDEWGQRLEHNASNVLNSIVDGREVNVRILKASTYAKETFNQKTRKLIVKNEEMMH